MKLTLLIIAVMALLAVTMAQDYYYIALPKGTGTLDEVVASGTTIVGAHDECKTEGTAFLTALGYFGNSSNNTNVNVAFQTTAGTDVAACKTALAADDTNGNPALTACASDFGTKCVAAATADAAASITRGASSCPLVLAEACDSQTCEYDTSCTWGACYSSADTDKANWPSLFVFELNLSGSIVNKDGGDDNIDIITQFLAQLDTLADGACKSEGMSAVASNKYASKFMIYEAEVAVAASCTQEILETAMLNTNSLDSALRGDLTIKSVRIESSALKVPAHCIVDDTSGGDETKTILCANTAGCEDIVCPEGTSCTSETKSICGESKCVIADGETEGQCTNSASIIAMIPAFVMAALALVLF